VKVEITLETELPAIIPKEQRKKNPDEKAFESQMKTLDNQIDDCRNKMKSINQRKREFQDGGTIGNTKVTYRDYLREKIDEMKAVKEERRRL